MNSNRRSIRCAIYTRKSHEEGLDQEFNSLDAQRQAGEAYIQSQRHEGWQCVPKRYDDGGFIHACPPATSTCCGAVRIPNHSGMRRYQFRYAESVVRFMCQSPIRSMRMLRFVVPAILRSPRSLRRLPRHPLPENRGAPQSCLPLRRFRRSPPKTMSRPRPTTVVAGVREKPGC